MNTPHNKDRIIDDGFNNTIRNGLGLPFHLKMSSESPKNDEQNRAESGKNLTNPKTRTTAKSSFIRKQTTARNGINDVHKLSKSNTLPLENDQKNLSNVLKENPSTSKGLFESLERYQRECFLQKASSISDEDDSPTCIQKPLRFRTGESIMCHMRENVHTEEAYLHYFLQLVQHEKNVKDDKISQNEFEIVSFQTAQPLKRTRLKGKRSNQHFAENQKRIPTSPGKSSARKMVMLRADMLAKNFDRTEKRMAILENFEDYCNDEESYSRYLTELIDFEENLIENYWET